MTTPHIQFPDPDNPGQQVSIPIDAQNVAMPGDQPGIAVVISPDGTRRRVVGDHQDVFQRLQAAAAQAHEGGAIEQPNDPVS